jgi:hypothetical protein
MSTIILLSTGQYTIGMKYIHVANQDLCQRLLALSGWRDTEHYWYQNWLRQDRWEVGSIGYQDESTLPAYDLGYLLDNLPPNTQIMYTHKEGKRDYAVASAYRFDPSRCYCELLADAKADTPVNALCWLAIALFQQGIIKKEDIDD